MSSGVRVYEDLAIAVGIASATVLRTSASLCVAMFIGVEHIWLSSVTFKFTKVLLLPSVEMMRVLPSMSNGRAHGSRVACSLL